MKRSTMATGLLIGLGLSLVGVLFAFGGQIQRWNNHLFETLWDIVLLGLGGGFIAFLFNQYSREREDRERDRVLQRETFNSLVAAYTKAKKVRRLMRARAVSLSPEKQLMVSAEQYDELFDDLNDARLEFEAQIRQIRARPKLFPSSKKLLEQLEAVERYLEKTTEEHEKELRNFSGSPKSRPLSELTYLQEFIVDYDRTKEFKSEFKVPFLDAIIELGGLLNQ